jgi:hypothetical protein
MEVQTKIHRYAAVQNGFGRVSRESGCAKLFSHCRSSTA